MLGYVVVRELLDLGVVRVDRVIVELSLVHYSFLAVSRCTKPIGPRSKPLSIM